MTRANNYDQDPDTGPGTVETVAGVEEEEDSVAAAEPDGTVRLTATTREPEEVTLPQWGATSSGPMDKSRFEHS